ncbi:MAG: glycoside hydrolase [Bacteroidales bacterium]|nr:glycoside hydrolase [Bacteroidales bacterium]
MTNRKIAVLLLSFLVYILAVANKTSNAKDYATVLSTRVICQQPDRYAGWPTISKTQEGELLVVFSGDRDWHVCPWGKTYLIRSSDNGQTWSEPEVINNTPLDDRDAGIVVSQKGTIIVSWFTSLAFTDNKSKFYSSRYSRYSRHAEKLTHEIREQWLGNWIRRSVDGGKTFSDPISTPGNSPHGPIRLSDGRLLYVTNKGIAESKNDGLSWEEIGKIPTDDKTRTLSEVHAVEATDGRIIALSRAAYLRQSFSKDGGYTWSLPIVTPMQGYPAHLIKLSNDWILATYCLRNGLKPGQRACVSKDNGETWDIDNEIILSVPVMPEESIYDYPPNWDIGYPSSVELDDGSIYTVYYQMPSKDEKPAIMATHWKINKDIKPTKKENK